MKKKQLFIALGALVVLATTGYLFMQDTGTFKGSAFNNFRTAPIAIPTVQVNPIANINNNQVAISTNSLSVDFGSMTANATNFVIKDSNGTPTDLAQGQRIQVYSVDPTGPVGNNYQIASSDAAAGAAITGMTHQSFGHYTLSMNFVAGLTYNARLMGSNGVEINHMSFDPNRLPYYVYSMPISSTMVSFTVKDFNGNLVDLKRNFRLQAYYVQSNGANYQVAGSDAVAGAAILPIAHSSTGTYSLAMPFTPSTTYGVRLMSNISGQERELAHSNFAR